NLERRKGALGDGQEVSEVRKAIEEDYNIQSKVDEFKLIKQMEQEAGSKKEDCPVTKSTFNEVKDFVSAIQDGTGKSRPN
ncbi:unnamed protein product, partial [Dovyalis caffra]